MRNFKACSSRDEQSEASQEGERSVSESARAVARSAPKRDQVDTQKSDCYRTEVMYAIIETGGKQYRVAEGDVIRCDIGGDAGSDVLFERVVLASTGKVVKTGSPLVDGASVKGTVVRRGRDKKVLVFHYKPKKRVRKLSGHRQHFAEVKITKINLS
jgi:large subunit ribosomal protein L21